MRERVTWYYLDGEKRVGPLAREAFEENVREGLIRAKTYVWSEGMPQWRPYGDVAREHGLDLLPGKESCASCGRAIPADELLDYPGGAICAHCKPFALQQLIENGHVPRTSQHYAGFWIRFVAKIVDNLLLMAVGMMFGVVVGVAAGATGSEGLMIAAQLFLYFLNMAIGAVYTTFFLGRYGATPGKMILKIRVVRSDGTPLTYQRALGRYFAEMLSSLVLCIGYIMAAFDVERRALHDYLCDTRVVMD